FDDGLLESVRAAAAPFPVAYTEPWFEGSDVRRYFVSMTDSHPNAEGHRILAEHIASFLLDQGWIQSGSPRECRCVPGVAVSALLQLDYNLPGCRLPSGRGSR